MKNIGRLFSYIILAANVLIIIFMLLSAYGSYVEPLKFPVWSCLGLVYIIFFFINLAFLIFWLMTKPLFMIAPLAGILFTWGAFTDVLPLNFSEDAEDGSIKILSYNVMGFRWQQADHDGQRNQIVKYIEDSGADIVCLQEYILSDLKNHLSEEDVVSRLSDYPYHRAIRVGGKNNINKIACFSKFPIIDSKRIEYESMYNGSAVFRIRVGKDTVIVINNHLESNRLTKEDKDAYKSIINTDDTERIKKNMLFLARKLADASSKRAVQARIVADKIKEYENCPIIVCGDFNDGPLSCAHRIINDGLTDAFSSKGAGMGISYNQNGFYFRIDNIMVNDSWNVHSCKVDNSIKDSDHYPITAVISRKKN